MVKEEQIVNKQAGLLMPVASLPNRHGIGDFGPETIAFLKALKKAGFSLWQILPLNPIGYGHSPYQPFSSLAMDEMYLSLDEIIKMGLLSKVPSYRAKTKHISYEKVKAFKRQYLKRAYYNAINQDATFVGRLRKKMAKYYDYALFMAFKKANNDKPWHLWNEKEKNWINNCGIDISRYDDEINYHLFVQDLLIKQWHKLKKTAHRLGIKIIGDLPFYVGHDSVDCYTNRDYFYLDEAGLPKLISGVGPDYFSKTGQRWGNPIYNFEKLKEEHYRFLIERILDCGQIYDYVRLDHFRAFDTYYVIDADEKTAQFGTWTLGPAYAFFDELLTVFDGERIIAEDLGDIRPEVLTLRDHYRFPGMNVLQFEILSGKEEVVNPHNVYYIGTHDNDTLKGWYLKLTPQERQKLRAFMRLQGYKGAILDTLIKYALNRPHRLVVLYLGDLLKLDNKARINKPGIIDDINWTYRLQSLCSFIEKEKKLRQLIKESQRL